MPLPAPLHMVLRAVVLVPGTVSMWEGLDCKTYPCKPCVQLGVIGFGAWLALDTKLLCLHLFEPALVGSSASYGASLVLVELM